MSMTLSNMAEKVDEYIRDIYVLGKAVNITSIRHFLGVVGGTDINDWPVEALDYAEKIYAGTVKVDMKDPAQKSLKRFIDIWYPKRLENKHALAKLRK